MPQDCRKPHKPQRVPLSLPTSQLRRGISDLEEELDILPREVPQELKLGPGQRLQPRLNCNSTHLRLYSKPPKPLPPPPPPRSRVKRSGSCKVVLPLFLAATIHAGVFFFTGKFFTMAPALVRATGKAPPRKPKKTTSHEGTACIGICAPCTNHGRGRLLPIRLCFLLLLLLFWTCSNPNP